jgi:hypothetical protein
MVGTGATGEGAANGHPAHYPTLPNVAGYGVFLGTLSDTRRYKDGHRVGSGHIAGQLQTGRRENS